ncbi:MAG: hypothetical protein ACW98F_04270 [Candidatus Hodarchaeales archaeon]|jgi:hypothetical protein
MELQKELTINLTYLGAILIGIVGVIIIIARLNDVNLPFVSNDKGAILALSTLGFLMCTMVMKFAIEKYGWMDISVLVSSILGGLIVLLVVAVFLNIEIPLISDDRIAFLTLGALLGIKVILTNGQRLLAISGIIS